MSGHSYLRLTRRGVLLGGAHYAVLAAADIRLSSAGPYDTDIAPGRLGEQSDLDYVPSLLEPMLA